MQNCGICTRSQSTTCVCLVVPRSDYETNCNNPMWARVTLQSVLKQNASSWIASLGRKCGGDTKILCYNLECRNTYKNLITNVSVDDLDPETLKVCWHVQVLAVCEKPPCAMKQQQFGNSLFAGKPKSVQSPTKLPPPTKLDDKNGRKTCGMCHWLEVEGQSLRRCSRCKATYYCNARCQRNHWPVHRQVCKKTE